MKGNSTPIKALVQVHSLALGGTQINAVDLAWAVAEHGCDTVIAGPCETLPAGPSLLDVAAGRGVAIELFDGSATTRAGGRFLNAIAEKHGVDLVHVYGAWNSRRAYWGPCRLGKRALVTTIYDMKVNAEMTGRGSELIIGTDYLLDEITGRTGGVHLISPPVDLERDRQGAVVVEPFLDAHAIARQGLRIVIVSRLDADMKALAVELAIKAADLLAHRSLQLIVVGTGDAAHALAGLAETVNQRHGRTVVHMVGAMADPRPAYASADIVIGMGGSAARALAFGKPLIVSGEFGWFRTFEPATASTLFRNSFWSDEKSADPLGELVGAIEHLSCSEDERMALGQFGRHFAEENFGLKAMAARLAAIYERAMTTRGLSRWADDLPLELSFLSRRLRGKPGYLPLDLHRPRSNEEQPSPAILSLPNG